MPVLLPAELVDDLARVLEPDVPAHAWVQADPALLRRVVDNLITNFQTLGYLNQAIKTGESHPT